MDKFKPKLEHNTTACKRKQHGMLYTMLPDIVTN